MRTNEERLTAVHARASELRREKRAKQTRLWGAAGVLLCLALAAAPAMWMPRFAAMLSGAPDTMSASIFAENGALGYLVTALLAFLLGVSATMFCLHLRKWREEKDREDRP